MIDLRTANQHVYRRRRAVALIAAVGCGVVAWLAHGAFVKPVDTDGARVVSFTINSSLVHLDAREIAIIPSGAAERRLPLLVFLHGKGENAESQLNREFFSALKALGANAPIVVFPYGGDDSYWHDRASGSWARYVTSEVIPDAVRRFDADSSRLAIGGLSMGGYGALELAERHRFRFCAVGGHSAALWDDGGEAAAGAFDNAEDFAGNNLMKAIADSSDPYPGAAVWIDVGAQDPFRSADAHFVADLRRKGVSVAFHVWPGAHDQSYWRSHWTSYLRFYARALANCRRAE